MDNIWVEGFKLVGAAAGIISGAFLVYDRFVRDRPQAYLARGSLHRHQVDLVLKNAANKTLIVDETGVAPNVLAFPHGHEIRDTVAAIYRGGEDVPESRLPCFFPVEPLGELKLGVVTFEAFKQLKKDDRITICLKWRN